MANEEGSVGGDSQEGGKASKMTTDAASKS